MHKNVIIKSIAELQIFTSITDVGTTAVDGIPETDKADNSVKLINKTNSAPYSDVTLIGVGSGH
ncbi:hypothetical protein EX84_15275, partial [Staphylococcus aureus]